MDDYANVEVLLCWLYSLYGFKQIEILIRYHYDVKNGW